MTKFVRGIVIFFFMLKVGCWYKAHFLTAPPQFPTYHLWMEYKCVKKTPEVQFPVTTYWRHFFIIYAQMIVPMCHNIISLWCTLWISHAPRCTLNICGVEFGLVKVEVGGWRQNYSITSLVACIMPPRHGLAYWVSVCPRLPLCSAAGYN